MGVDTKIIVAYGVLVDNDVLDDSIHFGDYSGEPYDIVSDGYTSYRNYSFIYLRRTEEVLMYKKTGGISGNGDRFYGANCITPDPDEVKILNDFLKSLNINEEPAHHIYYYNT